MNLTFYKDGNIILSAEEVNSADLPVLFALQNPEGIARHLVGPFENITADLKSMFDVFK